MKLQKLHERFIEKAHRPMDFGALPIRPSTPSAPVIPVERWAEAGGALYKTYRFRREVDKVDFVMQLLAHESECGHHAEIRIAESTVDLRLQTKNISKVTEIDREYARYADVLFRGLVYSSRDGDES